MVFDPKVYRDNRSGVGMPADDRATDATSDWTSVSLLKGLYYTFNTTGITVNGGATATKQDTGNTSLASIDTKMSTLAGYVDGLEALGAATQGPVTTGAATATKTNIAGAEYRATKPTFADTNQGPLQVGTRGSAIVQFALPDSTSPVTTQAAGADAVSNTFNAYFSVGLNYTFNGTTWDRSRSIINATNSTGTGIIAVGNLAQFDDTSPTSITENQFGNLRMSANRNLYGTIRDAAGNERGVNVDANNAASVVPFATAAAGGIASTSRIVSAAASTNATSAKGSAGRIYAIHGYNAATAVRYLKIYNKATSPTVGTDTPVKTLALPPGAGFAFDWPHGYSLATGIAYALTTGSADSDTGALTAADVVGLNVDYV